MSTESFEWDPEKDLVNQGKHGVAFSEAQSAFVDPNRVIAEDLSHSHGEKRYYCFGKVGGRYFDCQIHIPPWSYPDIRGRLLA